MSLTEHFSGHLWRPFLVILCVLLIPIVPFVVAGSYFDELVQSWLDERQTIRWTWLLVIGVLASDLFLPIPSSLVSTVGGWKLGILGGTAASWLGMTIGSVLGFAAARWGGAPFLRKRTTEEERGRVRAIGDRLGPWFLVGSRDLPVLAEATVLLAGVYGMSWQRFLAPVILANLGIALAYSAFGQWAQDRLWFPVMLGVSVAVPLLLSWLLLRIWRRGQSRPTTGNSPDDPPS